EQRAVVLLALPRLAKLRPRPFARQTCGLGGCRQHLEVGTRQTRGGARHEGGACVGRSLVERVEQRLRGCALAQTCGASGRTLVLRAPPRSEHRPEPELEGLHQALRGTSVRRRASVSANGLASCGRCRKKALMPSSVRSARSIRASLPGTYAPIAIRSRASRYAARQSRTEAALLPWSSLASAPASRLTLASTSMAGRALDPAGSRARTTWPSRMARAVSATGSFMSSPSTSTV